jgi:hypothetical protein
VVWRVPRTLRRPISRVRPITLTCLSMVLT